jgi:hypothetical protein
MVMTLSEVPNPARRVDFVPHGEIERCITALIEESPNADESAIKISIGTLRLVLIPVP